MKSPGTRLSYESVKKYFEEQGCELLELNYKNAHDKMQYRCCCGNESSINLINFKSGKRCGCKRAGVKLFSEVEIRQKIEDKGLVFLSSKYQRSKHIVTYVCHCGSKVSSDLKNAIALSGCLNCRDRKMALDYDFVKKYFEDQGCILLESEYKNARTKMLYKCSCGNDSQIVFDSFKRGNRCQECGNKKISDFLSGRVGENSQRWIKDRVKKRLDDLLAHKCRSMVKSAYKAIGQKKNSRTWKVLPYSKEELKTHLENHPNWTSVKDQKWEIDHIFPIKAFKDYKISDISVINSIENLQPLSKFDNNKKAGKYNPREFEIWLSSQGFPKVSCEKGGVE